MKTILSLLLMSGLAAYGQSVDQATLKKYNKSIQDYVDEEYLDEDIKIQIKKLEINAKKEVKYVEVDYKDGTKEAGIPTLWNGTLKIDLSKKDTATIEMTDYASGSMLAIASLVAGLNGSTDYQAKKFSAAFKQLQSGTLKRDILEYSSKQPLFHSTLKTEKSNHKIVMTITNDYIHSAVRRTHEVEMPINQKSEHIIFRYKTVIKEAAQVKNLSQKLNTLMDEYILQRKWEDYADTSISKAKAFSDEIYDIIYVGNNNDIFSSTATRMMGKNWGAATQNWSKEPAGTCLYFLFKTYHAVKRSLFELIDIDYGNPDSYYE